jgi:hypothetical protein
LAVATQIWDQRAVSLGRVRGLNHTPVTQAHTANVSSQLDPRWLG